MRLAMQNGASATGASSDALQLPATLDIAAAEWFLNEMRQRAGAGTPLRLDASGVETLTLPCVQIILAAARECGRIGVANPSDAFLAAFHDLGVEWRDFLEPVEDQTPEPFSSDPQQPVMAKEIAAPAEALDDPQTVSEPTMSKRIMTIDDSKTMRDMLMLTLTEAGFDVLQAVDGQDGLDKLANEYVDVVITDINMPKMDGYEVVRRLRDDPVYRSTPILVLTTESEVEKRDIARKAGATGWMVKPFDPERLVEAVRKVAA
jgi:two-component system chemotaxis response regulator CheY